MTVPAFQDLPENFDGGICSEDIECGLVEWVADILRLSEEQVYFEDQNIPEPCYPFVTMDLSTLRDVSPSPERRTRYVVGQDQGAEIEERTIQQHELVVPVSVHTDRKQQTAKTTAMSLAAKLRASLGTRTTVDALKEKGLSVIRREPTINTSMVVNGEWAPRATFDVVFGIPSVMVERTGYIETVQVTGTVDPNAIAVEVTVDAS